VALTKDPLLREINLDNPRLIADQDEVTLHIARMLKQNTALQSISLAKHGITDSAIEKFLVHFEKNRSVKSLDLHG
jgi:hypothetical protein